MCDSQPGNTQRLLPVGNSAAALPLSHFARVSTQVGAGDMMERTHLDAAHTGKKLSALLGQASGVE